MEFDFKLILYFFTGVIITVFGFLISTARTKNQMKQRAIWLIFIGAIIMIIGFLMLIYYGGF